MKKRFICFILSLSLAISAICFSTEKKVSALSKADILNSAELTPLKCGADFVDTYVENLFNQIFTPNMTTYEKVKACYDYIIYNSEYDYIGANNEIWGAIYKECYKSDADRNIITRGYNILTTGYGTCCDYSAAFVLLTRAIGLDSYYVGGKTNTVSGGYAGHNWVNIIINGTYYSFDPQVEDDITNRSSSGKIGYYRFCSTDKEMKGKLIYYNRQAYIDSFCNFERYDEYKSTVLPNKTGVAKIGTELSFNLSFENAAFDEVTYGLYIREGNYPEIDNDNIILINDLDTKNISKIITINGYKIEKYSNVYEGNPIKWCVDRIGTYTLYLCTRDGYGRGDYIAMLYTFIPKIQILIEENYVYGIPCKTKITDPEFKNDEKFIDSSGNELDEAKYISTGNKYVSDNIEYSIVIKGDTNGDGSVTSTDYLLIKKAFLNQLTLENEYYAAADIDRNGVLSSTDYLQVKKYFLGSFDLYE